MRTIPEHLLETETMMDLVATGDRNRKIAKNRRRLSVLFSKREKLDKEIETLETELKNLGADEFDD